MPDPDTTAALHRLAAEVARLNARHERPLRHLAFQFARGLAFGLGSVIGATILVSMAAWWLSQVEFLPLIGDWAARLADEINAARK